MAENKTQSNDFTNYYGGLRRRILDEIIKSAEALGILMKNAQCYQQYDYFKKQIENKEELKQKIMLFKRNQFEIETRKAQKLPVEAGEEKSLSDSYFDLMQNPDCAGYLTNERLVLEMLAGVYETIGRFARVDVSFLD